MITLNLFQFSGEILGMCAAVFVNPNHGFIGLYGVRPKHQNKGIGFTIWKKMMSNHVGSRNAGLYAVPKHLTMYRDKAGFKHQDSKHLFIYESSFDLKTDDLVKKINGIKIDVINEEIMSQVISYDAHVHGYLRSKLLPLTFREKDTLSLYAFDEIESTIVGFGCFRTNNVQKAMTGPLYADNDAIAELLIYELIETFAIAKQNGLLYMTLDSNPGGIAIAEKLRLEKHEELPRFFTKSVYDHAQWNRIYCIHSPNFSLC